jgi:hypothetical protein
MHPLSGEESQNLELCVSYLRRLARLDMALEIELGVTGGEEDGVTTAASTTPSSTRSRVMCWPPTTCCLRCVAYPLLLLSTLAHEMGHGIAALLAGGEFRSFELYSDGSGLAHTAAGSSLTAAIVAAGGLVGPAVAAALSFFAGKRPATARVFLALLCVGALVALLWVVRNAFGWLFVGCFAALLGALAFRASPRVSQIVLVFLGTQLGLSVFSRSDYLFTSTAPGRVGPLDPMSH